MHLRNDFVVAVSALALLLAGALAWFFVPRGSGAFAPEQPALQPAPPAVPSAAAPSVPGRSPAPPAQVIPRREGLRGTVFLSDGAPAVGAEVWAYSTGLPRDFASAITGADGRFSLSKLQHKTYDLTATLGDDAALMEGIPAEMDLTVQLAPRGRIFVRAANEAGQELPNVTYRLEYHVENGETGSAPEVQARLNTEAMPSVDEAISFKIGVPGTYRVHAATPAGATGTADFSWAPPSHGEFLTIRVTAGVTFSGIALDSQGNPVEGAEIELRSANTEDADRMVAMMAAPVAQSNAQGRFTIERIPRGTYTLIAEAAGHALTVVDGVEIAGQAVAGFQVVLTAGGAIQGTYTEHGAPVEGVVIMIQGNGLHEGASTAADGAFSFAQIPPGKYVVTARPVDPYKQVLGNVRSRVVDVEDGATADASFDLKGVSVTGAVSGLAEGGIGVARLSLPGPPLPATFGQNAPDDPAVMERVVAQDFLRAGGHFSFQHVEAGAYTLEIFTVEGLVPGVSPAPEAPALAQDITVGDAPIHLELALP